MNILQLAKYYPPTYGGIELVEKMMTKAHAEVGDNVFICAFSKENKLELGLFSEAITRIKERVNLLGAPFSFNFFWSFNQYLLKNKIDRIYVHLPNPFMHEVVARNESFLKKKKVEVIGVYHSDIVNKSFLGSLYSSYFLKTSSVYSKVLVSSNELWNSSQVLTQIASSKKRVIPFCIEDEGFAKKEVSFKGRLVSIGRLVPYKGFEFLIDALNNSEYELHIIGDGPLRDRLKKRASENIFFHHTLSHKDKNKLLAESDLVLVGSINRAEAYGMTIVEAFAQGIPVVAPLLNTGVNYLVQDNKTGSVYAVKNSQELKSKIDLIKNNPDLYSNLSASCYDFYKQNLTFDKFKASLLNL